MKNFKKQKVWQKSYQVKQMSLWQSVAAGFSLRRHRLESLWHQGVF
jgi:hypothetical protein